MVNIAISGFEWDKGNLEKCRKHGISLKEIERFFRQESIYIPPDYKHSEKEQRFLAIGKSRKGKPMFVVFTLRSDEGEGQRIHPISARFMHDKEARKYEKENTGNKNR